MARNPSSRPSACSTVLQKNEGGASHDESKIVASKFRLEKLLGEGGMGKVYLALDMMMDRRVALKCISSQYKEDEKRFLQEIRTAANLKHPNIITIYEVGEDQGRIFYTMEYVQGRNLAQQLQEKKKPSTREWLEIMLQVAQGIAYAHSQNVLHRDIKPENIMITNEGKAIVMDFGLAKKIEEKEAPASCLPDVHNPGITVQGAIMGTPLYMAPEIVDQQEASKLSDVYSLGMVLYYVLNKGKSAYAREIISLENLLHKIREVPPRRIRTIDHELWAICEKSLCKKPEHRITSADELAMALKFYLEGDALPPSIYRGGKMYRCKKWLRKNRVKVTTPFLLLAFATIAVLFILFPKPPITQGPSLFSRLAPFFLQMHDYLLNHEMESSEIEAKIKQEEAKWKGTDEFYQHLARFYLYCALRSDRDMEPFLEKAGQTIDLVKRKNLYTQFLRYQLYRYRGGEEAEKMRPKMSERSPEKFDFEALSISPLKEGDLSRPQTIDLLLREEWQRAISFPKAMEQLMDELKWHRECIVPYRENSDFHIPLQGFRRYSLMHGNTPISRADESVFIAILGAEDIRYLSVSFRGEIDEVVVHRESQTVLKKENILRQGGGERVSMRKIALVLPIMAKGIIEKFYFKGFEIVFPGEQVVQTAFSPAVRPEQACIQDLDIELDSRNYDKSLILYFRGKPISRETEYVIKAALDGEKIVFLFFGPNSEMKEACYDYTRLARLSEHKIAILPGDLDKKKEGLKYFLEGFERHYKKRGYRIFSLKKKAGSSE